MFEMVLIYWISNRQSGKVIVGTVPVKSRLFQSIFCRLGFESLEGVSKEELQNGMNK